MVSIEEINEDFIALDMLESTPADASAQGQAHIGSERQQEGARETAVPEVCGDVIRKYVSQDNQYEARLVEADTYLCIEFWHVEDPKAGRPNAILKWSEVVEKPNLPSTIDAGDAYNISLSYSASYLSMTDATTDYLAKPESGERPQGVFRIFEVVKSFPASSKSSGQCSISLVRSATVERLPGLQNYYGLGKFHIADDDDDDNIKKEVFITCNGASVQVYSLYGGWKYLHTISLDHPERASSRFNVAAEMIGSRQGRLFAWVVCGTDMIAVYDMEQGSMVSSVTRPCLDRSGVAFKTALDISDNGVLLAVYREGTLTTHYTKNGTLHEVLELPSEYSNVRALDFMNGNRQLIVHLRQENSSRMEGRWLIINVEDLSIMGTIDTSAIGPRQWLRADDLNIIPYHPAIPDCDDACQTVMSPLRQYSTQATRSGLRFQVELQSAVVVLPWESRDLTSAVVTIRTLDGLSSRTFTIPPPCDNENSWLYGVAVFLEDLGQLVVEGQGFVMVWGLPTSFDGDFTLIFVSLIEPRNAEWATCSHYQLYYQVPIVHNRGNKLSENGSQQPWVPVKTEVVKSELQERVKIMSLVHGIDNVIYMSLQASDSFKHAIFRYVAPFMSMKALGRNVLAVVIENWTPEHYDKLERFMAVFLSSPSGTMHPTIESVSYVLSVLHSGRKDPRSIGIARILIDKCIMQARAAMDPEYLVQIMRGLPELLNPKHSHSVLALHTLRRLAYFPVSSRKFIINHHIIAQPPTFQLWPWGKHTRPLHLCKDPILQLSGKRIYDPQNDNFTRELFVAPFDMLWEIRRRKGSSEAARKVTAINPVRLVIQVLRAFLYKLTPTRNTPVRCYDFTLEMLDNPALAALVEYKWNTIGFKCWLVRFLCQCCYYLLVIVTVLMQTYGSALQSSETLYFAIISCSAMFLYLEFIQCFRDWGRYFKSMYNLVDLLAFSFPLAAAISRLLILRNIITAEEMAMQLNAGLFGFSIPMVSLHLLFELRVLKTGGRYDPITEDLKSDNWAFQILMIAYFFFTVILMLNVLIALLNVAFNNGDTSWRQVWLRNRMRVVESAENLSYQIPGFREAYDWFPREIYYSVTHEQSKGYKRRWASEGEDREDEGAILRDKVAPVVSPPGDASAGERANTFSSARPASPSSGSNPSSTVVSSETGGEKNAAASPPVTRPADASTTVEGLPTTPNRPESSLQSLVSELERKMHLQPASFQDQIERLDTRFRQQEQFYQAQIERQDERLQQLQKSSNEQTRLLNELSALLR
ncbi:hypothetical protein BGZ68_002303 [Mortierella alpina]|nr:hypothetical protein BGZ68_002303 [Mortierella alpina]